MRKISIELLTCRAMSAFNTRKKSSELKAHSFHYSHTRHQYKRTTFFVDSNEIAVVFLVNICASNSGFYMQMQYRCS